MRRPTRIRVGSFSWRVRWTRKAVLAFHPDGSACGVCDVESLTIAVDPGKAEDYARSTLLHEILHACMRASDRHLEDDSEEAAVAAMTGPLLSTLRDNPRLIEYLTAP